MPLVLIKCPETGMAVNTGTPRRSTPWPRGTIKTAGRVLGPDGIGCRPSGASHPYEREKTWGGTRRAVVFQGSA